MDKNLLSSIYDFCLENDVDLTDEALEDMFEAGAIPEYETSDLSSVLEYCMEKGIVLNADQLASLKETFEGSDEITMEDAIDDYIYTHEFMEEFMGISISEDTFETMLESGQVDVIIDDINAVNEGVFDGLKEKSRNAKAASMTRKAEKAWVGKKDPNGPSRSWDDNTRAAELQKNIKKLEQEEADKKRNSDQKKQDRKEEREANRQERQQNRQERAEDKAKEAEIKRQNKDDFINRHLEGLDPNSKEYMSWLSKRSDVVDFNKKQDDDVKAARKAHAQAKAEYNKEINSAAKEIKKDANKKAKAEKKSASDEAKAAKAAFV